MNFRFSRVAAPPGVHPPPTLVAGAAASRPPWQPPSADYDALPAAALQLCKTRTKHRKLDS